MALSSMKNGKANMFIHFKEGILQDLLDESKQDEAIQKNLRYWKNAYES